jgi:hypothetical protein
VGTRFARRYALIMALPALQVLFAAEPEGTFADRLFDKKEYAWARIEYERLLYRCPGSAEAVRWRYRCARSLMLCGDFNRAALELRAVPESDPLSDSARLYRAVCALRRNEADTARQLLSSSSLDYAKVLGAYLDFSARRYSAALETLKTVAYNSHDAFTARSLEKTVSDASAFRKKQYGPALCLALIPGLGHLYAGRRGDAAMSAMTISTGALIAGYYAYHQSRARAYAVGAVTGLFYAGSIYGAAVSVKIYNRSAVRRFCLTADRIVFGP